MAFLTIQNIKKVYPKSENLPPALENINIEINNRGLIFITGKSGSGKSTLLNLIGGLDAPTSGDIILKERAYSSFKETDFDSLRRNEIGFIFQDFCLIDGLNVLENVKFAATIKDEVVDDNKILEAIEAVGLKGYEDHLAHELSAGQRQRVAIARAIIKSPEIILCDEPTGNLDFITSHEVLTLLKNLSKERLVIIVSHNLEDAYVFADRIIELKGGHLVNDLETHQAETIVGDTAYISGLDFFSKKELSDVNEKIRSGEIKGIKSRKELFSNYHHEDKEYENIVHKNKHISIKKSFKLMNSLLRKQFLKIGLFSFVGALIASIFAVSFMFINVDKDTIYKQVGEQTANISNIYRKNYKEGYHPTQVYMMDENEIDKVKKILPKEDVYPMVSYNSFYSNYSYLNNKTYPAYDLTDSNNLMRLFDRSLYLQESSGVLITNEEFVKQTLNVETLEYVALADEIKPEGIYVTDYLVEQYIARTKATNPVEFYVGNRTNNIGRVNIYNQRYINGIIKTNYKEEYKEVLDELDHLRTNNPGLLKDYQNKQVFRNYAKDAYHRYITGFSYNANFLNDFYNSNHYSSIKSQGAVMYINYNDEDVLIHDYKNTSFGNYSVTNTFIHFNNYETDLPENTVMIPYTVLNNIFQSSYTVDEWNARLNTKLTIQIYDYITDKEKGSLSFNLVVGKSISAMAASQDVVNALKQTTTKYASFFLGKKINPVDSFRKLARRNYMCINVSTVYVYHIVKGIASYIDFFKIILSFAVIALLAVVAFVSYNNVRRFTYEIGVIKSLGASSQDVHKIFTIQELYLLITSIIFSIVGVIVATVLANKVLSEAFNRNYSSRYTINVLHIDAVVMLVVIFLIIAISVVSMIIPFIRMHRLKPINILKSRY